LKKIIEKIFLSSIIFLDIFSEFGIFAKDTNVPKSLRVIYNRKKEKEERIKYSR